MLFWAWALPAGFLFFILGWMVVWAALANSQSDPSYLKGAWFGLLTLTGGIPLVAFIAAIWPAWIPFAIAADVAEKRKGMNQANPFK